uniref:Uncharacterized protein n=1 Tax=Romanomermis culicivorax TaxID=13658 RepID=A0A915IUL8_ROMCU
FIFTIAIACGRLQYSGLSPGSALYRAKSRELSTSIYNNIEMISTLRFSPAQDNRELELTRARAV